MMTVDKLMADSVQYYCNELDDSIMKLNFTLVFATEFKNFGICIEDLEAYLDVINYHLYIKYII